MPPRSSKPKRSPAKSSAERVRAHRAKLRAQGLRPVQIWLPDTNAPEFIEQARRESLAAANSPTEAEEQAWIDSIADPDALYNANAGLAEGESRVRRGEMWTIVGPRRAGPRRVVVLQGDDVQGIESVTVCHLTPDSAMAGVLPIGIEPDGKNGLDRPAWVVVESISTIPKRRLDRKIGEVGNAEMSPISQAIILFLDLSPRSS